MGGEPVWISTGDASRALGITQQTLYRLIDAGQLPANRSGRARRLRQQDVDAFIESCRNEPGTLSHLYASRSANDEQPDEDGAG